MTTLEIVIGILLFIMAIFLIVSILMQSGKSKKLSGTIAGGAETFFGKEKGQAIDRTLSKVTNVVSLIFVALILVLLFADAKNDAEANKNTDTGKSPEESTEEKADAAESSEEAVSSLVSEEASVEVPEADDASAEVSAAVAESSEA
ncbi:MAG: preprotein translocase subunit SecG [Clostridia bacterium]|nr:preprotein translocase subunit SecG [Clostridia bacterium]MBQ7048711.1 preprotein translocase subunit SecG [Clostridia bacterium]